MGCILTIENKLEDTQKKLKECQNRDFVFLAQRKDELVEFIRRVIVAAEAYGLSYEKLLETIITQLEKGKIHVSDAMHAHVYANAATVC